MDISLFCFLCGFPLIGVGGLCIISLPIEWYFFRVKGWRYVQGTIQISTAKEDRTEFDDGRINISYEPNIEYQYYIGGKSYVVEDSPFFNAQLGERGDYPKTRLSAIQDLIRRYPVGKQVKVAYDPKNPQNSTLEPDVAFINLIYNMGIMRIPIGFIFIAAGVGLIHLAFKID